MTISIEIYKTRNFLSAQPWRWRAVASNGRVMANGGESYTNRSDLKAALQTLFSDAVPVYVTEPGVAEAALLREGVRYRP